MPRTLRMGSTGPDVAELQNGLNRLPTQLPALAPDGIFGMRTHTRVQELQRTHQLTSDGIVGPMTWELFTRLLAAIQQGTLPPVPAGAYDLMRPIVLTVAQQHLGVVDFSVIQGGRPKGLDFLIQLFRESANVTLTDANFRDEKGAWIWTPWVGLKHQRKSWCGIFAVWCYRKAGIPVRWDIGIGGPVGPLRLSGFSTQFAANIRPADSFGRYGGETNGTFRAELREVAADGEGHVVGVHRNTGTRNGKQLDVDCCIVFEIRNGRAMSGREYFFDLHAWDAFWS